MSAHTIAVWKLEHVHVVDISPSLHLGVTEFQYSHRKRLGNPSSGSVLRSVPCKILQIPTAMVWLRMAPISSSFECLVTRE